VARDVHSRSLARRYAVKVQFVGDNIFNPRAFDTWGPDDPCNRKLAAIIPRNNAWSEQFGSPFWDPINGPYHRSDQLRRQGTPLRHFLTILCRAYHEVALYLAYSFTCARQSAEAFFKAAAWSLFAALALNENKPHRLAITRTATALTIINSSMLFSRAPARL
jgi:hypothetical protein